MKLFLILEDHTVREFGIGDSVQSLIRAIKREDVKTIVAGDKQGKTVLWEKQFNAVTVLPTDFGKGKQ
jgi:hypothetical protein